MATATQVQVLYIAYFGRPADPDGLAFWTNGVAGSNEELDLLADSFAETPEYRAAIQGLSTKQIIDLFYDNLFSRTAEQEGEDFWLSGIESGALDPQDIGVDIGLAALNANPPNSDSVAIGAKADAANKYTKALEANPADKADYAGSQGVEAGRAYLEPVIDVATIPSDAEVQEAVNNIPAGGGGGGGGAVNQYALTLFDDQVTSVNTRQYQIINGAQGPFIKSFPFSLNASNQTITAVASDNNQTNTLNTLDSLVDSSTTDSDTLTITASGGSNLQRATVTNIENIAFNLAGYTGGTLIAAAAGINATGGLDTITTTGSFTAGTAVIDATGTGASSINTAGMTAAADGAFTITSSDATTATSVTGGAADETYTAFSTGTAVDTINLGAGDNNVFNAGNGADVITHDTAGANIDIRVNGTSTVTLIASQTEALATVINNVVGGVNASTSTAGVALIGTGNSQTFTGGSGDDFITGNAGGDVMTGGGGSNTFYFRTGDVDTNEAVTLTGTTDTFNVVTTTVFDNINAGASIIGLDNIVLAESEDAEFLSAQLTGLTVGVNGLAGNDTELLKVDASSATAAIDLSGFTLTNASSNINGGTGINAITGSKGVDTIDANAGADNVTSGTGADIIAQGATAGVASSGRTGVGGAATADTEVFIFATGVDVITDFTGGGGGDKLKAPALTSNTIKADGDATGLSGTDVLLLRGTYAAANGGNPATFTIGAGPDLLYSGFSVQNANPGAAENRTFWTADASSVVLDGGFANFTVGNNFVAA